MEKSTNLQRRYFWNLPWGIRTFGWRHFLDSLVPSRTPVQGWAGWERLNLRSPTGGLAYGIPLNDKILAPFLDRIVDPETAPFLVFTMRSGILLQGNISVKIFVVYVWYNAMPDDGSTHPGRSSDIILQRRSITTGCDGMVAVFQWKLVLKNKRRYIILDHFIEYVTDSKNFFRTTLLDT